MSTSTIIAMLIFAIIAVRQWLPDWLRIWHVMLAGAVLIVATGETSPAEAFDYVDWNIIAYLFGVFSIGIALYQGGVPHRVSEWLASHRHSKPAALAGLMISNAASGTGSNRALVLWGAVSGIRKEKTSSPTKATAPRNRKPAL